MKIRTFKVSYGNSHYETLENKKLKNASKNIAERGSKTLALWVLGVKESNGAIVLQIGTTVAKLHPLNFGHITEKIEKIQIQNPSIKNADTGCFVGFGGREMQQSNQFADWSTN